MKNFYELSYEAAKAEFTIIQKEETWITDLVKEIAYNDALSVFCCEYYYYSINLVEFLKTHWVSKGEVIRKIIELMEEGVIEKRKLVEDGEFLNFIC